MALREKAPDQKKTEGPLKTLIASWLATWFLSGRVGKAPGTAGSIAALPFAYGLIWLGGPALLFSAASLLFLVGLWAVRVQMGVDGKHDPPSIVIDEVVGQWLTLLVVPLSPLGFLLGLIAFRVFDILKPWPISWLDRHVKGALGVMIDDVAAALYAIIAMLLLFRLIGP